jgi:hypothetical protein
MEGPRFRTWGPPVVNRHDSLAYKGGGVRAETTDFGSGARIVNSQALDGVIVGKDVRGASPTRAIFLNSHLWIRLYVADTRRTATMLHHYPEDLAMESAADRYPTRQA